MMTTATIAINVIEEDFLAEPPRSRISFGISVEFPGGLLFGLPLMALRIGHPNLGIYSGSA